MSDILRNMEGKFADIALDAIEKKVNGRLITCDVEKRLDERYGEKRSENIQRGPIKNVLKEMFEGLYMNEPDEDLIHALNEWRAEVLARIKKGE